MKPLTQSNKLLLLIAFLSPILQGSIIAQPDVARHDTVKIGLLLPDSKSPAARYGVELAIRKANASGGFEGRPFKLLVKYLEGPWGTGSRQAIDLIFEEKVWALLGSHDGRNAHLVEQAATKARVVFVSAWTGDPTLSQAFVPWFFNCIPNDDQQAFAIVGELGKHKPGEFIALVYDDEYDSRMMVKSFLMKSDETGKNKFSVVQMSTTGNDPAGINAMICSKGCTSLVLFCKPETAIKILTLPLPCDLHPSVYASSSVLDENVLQPIGAEKSANIINVPSYLWNENEFSRFRESYFRNFGRTPGAVAAYAYDATNILITAIKKAGGPDREKIQEALYNLNYTGVTGTIRFDNHGNRTGNIAVTGTENGIPSYHSR